MSGTSKIMPKTDEHHVGVEIELHSRKFPSSSSPGTNRDSPSGRTQLTLPPALTSFMEIDWEGTGDSRGTGWEASMCAPQSQYKMYLRQFLTFLETLDPFPCEGSTGTHVHLDIRHRDKERVRVLAESQYRAIATKYTGAVRARSYIGAWALGRSPYNKTVEFRSLEQTYDYEKLCNYIDECIAMVTPADLPVQVIPQVVQNIPRAIAANLTPAAATINW